MKIKRLVIENFKSIERIELIEPNPFTVFVGPNGSGKSNIFEALEFVNLHQEISSETVLSLFGGNDGIARKQNPIQPFNYSITTKSFFFQSSSADEIGMGKSFKEDIIRDDMIHDDAVEAFQHFTNFTRLFVGNDRLVKLRLTDNRRLSLSATNLNTVLKRIFKNETLKREIFEWLELFVPEFKAVEITTNSFDGRDTLLWYEQFSEKPFTKELISDGTYNILALLTAVYQSDDKPQFLCIEEPENGLHPQVARELVDSFRIMCEERGHYIWLNTHSQSMVSRLRPEELVIVEKKQGTTQTRQFKKEDFYGMRVDEAWLTNSLGGGLAW